MATPVGVTPGAAKTLLTFARKRPLRDSDTAVGAAKRVRVSPAGGEGGTSGGASEQSPWARVRSGRPGQQGAGVERTLFVAPDAVPRERTALAPSRSANSGGSGLAVLVDKAPVQRRGACRGAAGAGLRDKVDFFRAVDQEVRGGTGRRQRCAPCRKRTQHRLEATAGRLHPPRLGCPQTTA